MYSSSEDEQKVPTHSIVFKCVGSIKGATTQSTPKSVSGLLKNGEVVPVKLSPEPKNSHDAHAIAFHCKLNDRWQHYIVTECLDAIHDALSNNTIINTEFSWVRYIVHWSKSGPGWYAGIKIVKKGNWPKIVVHSSSRIR